MQLTIEEVQSRHNYLEHSINTHKGLSAGYFVPSDVNALIGVIYKSLILISGLRASTEFKVEKPFVEKKELLNKLVLHKMKRKFK